MVKTGQEYWDGMRAEPALGKLLSTEYRHTHPDMAGRASRACSSWVAGHWSVVMGSGAQGFKWEVCYSRVREGIVCAFVRVCSCVYVHV